MKLTLCLCAAIFQCFDIGKSIQTSGVSAFLFVT